MNLFLILLLSLSLAADAFSVGAVVGLDHVRRRQVFRLSFHFGLFQALFALIGVVIGVSLASIAQGFTEWVACILLVLIGMKMVRDALFGSEDEKLAVDLTKGKHLVGLSTAVSIDALAAGTSLGVTNTPIALSVVLIGLTSMVGTFIAMKVASKIGGAFGRRIAVVGGVVLITLGVLMVL